MVVLNCSLQSKECLNKLNLLQRKLANLPGISGRVFGNSCRQLAMQPLHVLFKCDKKFFVESHRKTKQHQRKLKTKSKSQSKQTVLQLNQVNFKEQDVSSILAEDIPLHKLNHPFLMSLCYNGKSIAFGDCSPDMCC